MPEVFAHRTVQLERISVVVAVMLGLALGPLLACGFWGIDFMTGANPSGPWHSGEFASTAEELIKFALVGIGLMLLSLWFQSRDASRGNKGVFVLPFIGVIVLIFEYLHNAHDGGQTRQIMRYATILATVTLGSFLLRSFGGRVARP